MSASGSPAEERLCQPHLGIVKTRQTVALGVIGLVQITRKQTALYEPDLITRLNTSLLEPVVETSEESKAFIAAEVPKHVALLKAAHFEAQ